MPIHLRQITAAEPLSAAEKLELWRAVQVGERHILERTLASPDARPMLVRLGHWLEGEIRLRAASGRLSEAAAEKAEDEVNPVSDLIRAGSTLRGFLTATGARDAATWSAAAVIDAFEGVRLPALWIRQCVKALTDRSVIEDGREGDVGLGRAACAVADAKARVVEANQRFVMSLARRYAVDGLPVQDLVQEGNLGLLDALDRFDHRRGIEFSTYALWWIRRAMIRALGQQSRTVRLPVNAYLKLRRVQQIRRHLEAQLGREAHASEVAAVVGPTFPHWSGPVPSAPSTLSLHQQLNDADGATWGDVLDDRSVPAPIDSVMMRQAIARIHEALQALQPLEERTLRLRFGIGNANDHTQEEVSRELGVTVNVVRRVEARALRKLRTRTELRSLEG